MKQYDPGLTMKILPCNITVDKEGVWHYEGRELIRRDIVEYLLENVVLGKDGKYVIETETGCCELDVADTPFVISRVDRVTRESSGEEQILLFLRHLSSKEVLDPETLHVGAENVLYCRIRRGIFPARFSRPAYYEFAAWVQEDDRTGEFFIELNGKHYPIRGGDPGHAS